MRIGMRLLLGYFLIVAIAAWFVLSIFLQEVKPGVRRATEGTLIDTATLLAEFAKADIWREMHKTASSRRRFPGLTNTPSRPISVALPNPKMNTVFI